MIDVALLTRMAPLVESVVVLAESGYGRESLLLNRPLFEHTVDAYWTEANRDLAGERFLAHARFTQHLQRDRLKPCAPRLGIEVREQSLEPAEIATSTKLFGKYASKSWTGVGLHARIESFRSQLDPAEHEQLDFVVDVLHAATNSELHPSTWSLSRALRYTPDGSDHRKLQYRAGPEPELAPLAVGYAWWLFLKALDRMHGLLSLPSDDLQLVADQGAELLGLTRSDEPESHGTTTRR